MPKFNEVSGTRGLKDEVDKLLASFNQSPLDPKSKDKIQIVPINSKKNLEELREVLSQPDESKFEAFIVNRFEILQIIDNILKAWPSTDTESPLYKALKTYFESAIANQKGRLIKENSQTVSADNILTLIYNNKQDPAGSITNKKLLLDAISKNATGIDKNVLTKLSLLKSLLTRGDETARFKLFRIKREKKFKTTTINLPIELLHQTTLDAIGSVGSPYTKIPKWNILGLITAFGWNRRTAAAAEYKDNIQEVKNNESTEAESKKYLYGIQKNFLKGFLKFKQASNSLKYLQIDFSMVAYLGNASKQKLASGGKVTSGFLFRQSLLYGLIYLINCAVQILMPLVSLLGFLISVPIALISKATGIKNPFLPLTLNAKMFFESVFSIPLIIVRMLPNIVSYLGVLNNVAVFGRKGHDKIYTEQNKTTFLKMTKETIGKLNLSRFTRASLIYLKIVPEAVAQDPVLKFFANNLKDYSKNAISKDTLQLLNNYVSTVYKNMSGRENILNITEPAFLGDINALKNELQKQILINGNSLTPSQKQTILSLVKVINDNLSKLDAPLIDYTNIANIPAFDPENFKHLQASAMIDLRLLRKQGQSGVIGSPVHAVARKIDSANKAGKEPIPGYVIEYSRSRGEKYYNTLALTDTKNILGISKTEKNSYRPTSIHVRMGDYLIKDKQGTLLGKINFDPMQDTFTLKMLVQDTDKQVALISSYLKFVSNIIGDSLIPVVTIENMGKENEIKIEDFLSDNDLQVHVKYRGEVDKDDLYLVVPPPPPESEGPKQPHA